MKIENGKYYRTRDGQKVGPMKTVNGATIHRWAQKIGDGMSWSDDGSSDHCSSIIAEWSEPADLTAITTAFGLLDAETQQAFKAHGGPYEMYNGGGWVVWAPRWTNTGIYRVKPKPVVNEVVMVGGEDICGNWGFEESQLNPETHKITFNIVEGVPDCNSIKMERL